MSLSWQLQAVAASPVAPICDCKSSSGMLTLCRPLAVLSSSPDCTACVPAHANRCCILRTPYIYCGSTRVDRCCPLRTPYMNCVAARADRCCPLRTPCIDCGSARAERYRFLRTPCIDCGSARAGRCCLLRTPWTGTIGSQRPQNNLWMALPSCLRRWAWMAVLAHTANARIHGALRANESV